MAVTEGHGCMDEVMNYIFVSCILWLYNS